MDKKKGLLDDFTLRIEQEASEAPVSRVHGHFIWPCDNMETLKQLAKTSRVDISKIPPSRLKDELEAYAARMRLSIEECLVYLLLKHYNRLEEEALMDKLIQWTQTQQ